MHEELIQRLRTCGNSLSCNKCKWRPECDGPSEAMRKAADAIEELSGLISRYDSETGIKSEKSKREDHDDVSVDFGFTCEVCALFKHNVSAFDIGCEGDSEICECFDPLD